MSGDRNEQFLVDGMGHGVYGFTVFALPDRIEHESDITRDSCYNRVVKALPRSAWVEQRRRSFDELSFRSRWHFINAVSGAFLYPSYIISKGLFDESEVVAFPAGLRSVMVVSAWFSIIGFLWLIFAVALLVFTRAG